MLWSVFLTTPLMVGIQVVSARDRPRHRATASPRNLRDHYPRPLLWFIVSLLLVANTINIAADIGAMGEALQLVVGGPSHGHALMFGVLAVLMQLFLPYQRLAPVLKWLTLSLFAYVARAARGRRRLDRPLVATLLAAARTSTRDYLMLLVAVLGTTISPYLFFWQASQEVEEQRATDGDEPLTRCARAGARDHLRRIKIDTWLGMTFSNAHRVLRSC